ncbi:ubiquitin-conjugating enzyme E2C-binding protein [Xylaria sp. CBS 124048]|nr:ubiquitin-conjugating enzyme E2C-binding protein [Xylaria sp. CBS 124048]
MPPSQHILIYAELLSNIRQVSVGCSLPTPASESTQAYVAPDGRALTVIHGGLRQTIQLPGSVAFSSQLPVDRSRGTGLSWRLPLTTRPAGPAEDSVPWSAIDLRPGSPVFCKSCKATVVNAGTLRIWKDLPSENWAEMMEFWHCHKPSNLQHSHDEEHLTTRGYGASSRIAAQPGVGFVDLTSFMLAYSDVLESSISTSTSTDKTASQPSKTLYCVTCKTQLGVYDDKSSSISLFKWQVLVNQQSQITAAKSPSLVQCVSAMLLATVARSGCSKSILLPIGARARPLPDASISKNIDRLNIWVFNANITFSSTEASTSPTNAVKVFYRIVSQEAADQMLESVVSDYEDISLPAEAIATITELLNKSNSFVPESDRRFKDWMVGLLNKWDGGS